MTREFDGRYSYWSLVLGEVLAAIKSPQRLIAG